MEQEQIDLETIRGDDDGWIFEAFEDDGSASDLSGCRFDLWIKPSSKGETIKLSTTTGEIVIDGNQIIVALSHDKTQGVKWDSATWDLQCTNAIGLIQTVAGGEFILNHDVTEA